MGRKLRVREREDLRGIEARPEQVVLVRRDVQAVGVRPDVRVVLEARPGRRSVQRAPVIGSAVGPVVLQRERGRSSTARSGRRCSSGNVDRVLPVERARRADAVQRRDRDNEPVVLRGRSDRSGRSRRARMLRCPVDRGRIPEERVQVLDSSESRARARRVDAETLLIDLDREAVALRTSLIGGLERELVATVRESLIAPVQPLQAQSDLGIRPGDSGRGTVGASSGFFENLPFLKPGRGRSTWTSPLVVLVDAGS